MDLKNEVIEKFTNKTATVGIVGLGYVGLPLALRFTEAGFKVLGFDVDDKKVNMINDGLSYIEHIHSEEVTKAKKSGFNATTDYQNIKDVDAIIICVPTPLSKHRDPDLSFVISTTESIAPYIKRGQLISLESTTYPGTTDEELLPRLEAKSGLKVGEDFFLVFSPEREDPGRKNFTTKTTPKIVGGITNHCLETGCAMYAGVIDRVVPVSDTKTAEMTKLLENIHRAVNIGLVNEMKIVADKMGIDIHEVIRAAATKPFGFTPFYPGPGLGGHCIPIDPFYLTWKAREHGVHTRFIELAGEVNAAMPDYVVGKVVSALNKNKKAAFGSKILVLGISYKKNVDDMRESPSVFMMERLRDLGAEVDYSDPHVPVFPKMRDHSFNLSSIDLSPEVIREYDCVLIATDHEKFNYDMILEHAQFIVDSRGKYLSPSQKVIKA